MVMQIVLDTSLNKLYVLFVLFARTLLCSMDFTDGVLVLS